MSSLAIPATIPTSSTTGSSALEEFEDGQTVRRFECVECGAVRFE